ncbi:hypothetical protein ACFL27_20850 [candidate division CSSED10-310 bacterium]|uniref:Uncharacterized protein n=1 Tax=candidate division CSSED10-310 bacterium TaxID=2855610 RepID=A0ABV6Z2H5_UNCC1
MNFKGTLTVSGTTAPGSDVISVTATVVAVNETDNNSANNSATEATTVSTCRFTFTLFILCLCIDAVFHAA